MENFFSEESYLTAIESLISDSPSFAAIGSAAYKPGLERVVAMDELLGKPSVGLRYIHVAGTNGKGSVCNMLAASFAARGKKVGLYTSPHILDFRERIRIVRCGGAELVTKEWVFDFLQKYQADIKRLGLSFFEITTAMCLKYFSEQMVDIAIMETGLGGRFDATNVIRPELSVITNIGYDHMDILGDTLPKIATEKAGIIKEGVPVVIGERDEATAKVFEQAARQAGSRIFFADDFQATDKRLGIDLPVALPSPDEMDLPGIYQAKNLRTVACALHVCGLQADAEVLKRAAHICGFHARWEKILDKPYTICDIGHNEHGLKYNFAQLSQMLLSGEVSDIVMVYGSVRDKDVDAVLRLLPPQASIIFTAADNPRAMPAGELFERFCFLSKSGAQSGTEAMVGAAQHRVCPSVADAVQSAIQACKGMHKPLLYIGGSTYVVSEALQSLNIEF